VRKEREQEHQFFMHTIRQVATGLLAFDKKGAVRLSNKALFNLLGIESVTKISRLSKVHPDLPDLLVNLHPGEQYLLKITAASSRRHISVMTSSFTMEQQLITLASFRDISRDLDKNEVEAWQKMMRVVIHEIVSSVVPFRLFSSKLLSYLEPEDKNKRQILLEGVALDDAVNVLNNMNKRSKGLARFAESYKTLSQEPVPEKQVLDVAKLFRDTELYISDKLQAAKIKLSIQVEPFDLLLSADEQLIFQVLVNLVTNAIYAMSETNDPQLVLKGYSNQSDVILEVSDNGHGIPKDILDSIFVPFFTTRKDGSGIGLSLSKQIMNAHNGNILALSEGGGGTTFRLVF
jgi:signal transduction histidine kinase